MRQWLLQLWNEEAGSASPVWALVVSILVLGAITGLVKCRQADLSKGDRPAVVRTR